MDSASDAPLGLAGWQASAIRRVRKGTGLNDRSSGSSVPCSFAAWTLFWAGGVRYPSCWELILLLDDSGYRTVVGGREDARLWTSGMKHTFGRVVPLYP